MKDSILHFAVLIPHRETERKLRTFSQKLFQAGFHGARALPPVAPLVLLKKPVHEQEWKEAAEYMRIQSLQNDSKGSIHASGPVPTRFGASFSVLSLVLDIPAPSFSSQSVSRYFTPALWLACIEEYQEYTEETISLQFRTAALGELTLKPLVSFPGSFSFQWKVRTKVWLPNPKKTKD